LRTRRTFWIGALALVAFVLIVLARFPAAWVLGKLPAGFSCDAIDGTVWNGTCSGLMLRHQQLLGDVAWQLRPLRLLLGRLAAHVELTQTGDFVNADLELGLGGHVWASDVHANVHLIPGLMPQLPTGLRGVVRADLSRVELEHGRLADLQGRIEAHDLAQSGETTTELGSYGLSFTPAASRAAAVGELHDLGGPLDLSGTLRMTPEPGFVLEGKVAARATASANLVRQLQMLGAPDAQGRRSFSIANTF
jgi:Type II secretion system (T2SS), protein N